MVIAAKLARTWPMVRIRLPPICSMAANMGPTRARTLAMLWFRPFGEEIVTAAFALDTSLLSKSAGD